ncbi:hypothetical protein N7475_001422 [Penicillium sp. IBT 31633x]|nr:hypothetical protein N7475_001422 [Penicillium sp. IBT 31633x]
MKGIILVSLFGATALAHPQVNWWGTDECWTSPDNTDNQCSDVQNTGFDWSGLANDDDWSVDGFNFDGFEPKNDCRGPGRQSNCIAGTLSGDDDWKTEISAADAPFSIRNFHISTSRDTDVYINYKMPDGSSCHQTASCSFIGTDVTNDQCGGASSVEFMLPEDSEFDDCDIEIHSIDFDCSEGPKTPGHPMVDPPHSHSAPTPSSTTFQPHVPQPSSVVSEVSSSSYFHKDPETSTTKTTARISSSSSWHHDPETSTTKTTAGISSSSSWHHDPETSTVWNTPKVPATTHYSKEQVTSTIWSLEEVTVTKCAPAVTDCPSHSTLVVASSHSVPTTVWHPSVVASSTTSVPPIVTAPCPDVVPKCINTWLSIPKCDSNSDAACFCPSSEFTDKVGSCIRSWSSSKEQEQSGLSYFAGICAPYVPNNPAIVEIVPPSPPLSHVPATTVHSHITAIPPTSVHTAAVVTTAPLTAHTTITWSTHTATVPQVRFSTVTGSSTTSVGLVLVTPTPSQPKHSVQAPPSSMTTRHTFPLSTPTISKPSGAKPTETFLPSNAGSKLSSCSFWAFGAALLALVL